MKGAVGDRGKVAQKDLATTTVFMSASKPQSSLHPHHRHPHRLYASINRLRQDEGEGHRGRGWLGSPGSGAPGHPHAKPWQAVIVDPPSRSPPPPLHLSSRVVVLRLSGQRPAALCRLIYGSVFGMELGGMVEVGQAGQHGLDGVGEKVFFSWLKPGERSEKKKVSVSWFASVFTLFIVPVIHLSIRRP